MTSFFFIALSSLLSFITFALFSGSIEVNRLELYMLSITYGATINLLVEAGRNVVYLRASLTRTTKKFKNYHSLQLFQSHRKILPIFFLLHSLYVVINMILYPLTYLEVLSYIGFVTVSYIYQIISTHFQIQRDYQGFGLLYRNLAFSRLALIGILSYVSLRGEEKISFIAMLWVNIIPFCVAIIYAALFSVDFRKISLKERDLYESVALRKHKKKSAVYALLLLPISRLDYFIVARFLPSNFLQIYHLFQLILQGANLIIGSIYQRYILVILSRSLRSTIFIALAINILILGLAGLLNRIVFEITKYLDQPSITSLFSIFYENIFVAFLTMLFLSISGILALYTNKTYRVYTALVAAMAQATVYSSLLAFGEPKSLIDIVTYFSISQVISIIIHVVNYLSQNKRSVA